MKRALIAVLFLIIICLGGLFIAPSFIDWNIYKEKAISEVKSRAGLDLNIGGDLDFALLPYPHLTVNEVAISSPDGSKSDNLLSFNKLEVDVDLMPLFKGQLSVNSITLVKPVIAIEMLENGSLNLMTKELQSLSEAKGDDASSKPISMPEISLEKIRIKDGVFSYFDHNSNASYLAENINADLSAASLSGPFKAQGSLFYNEQLLDFDIDSGDYDAESKTLSPKVKLTLKPDNIRLEYAGAVSFAEGFFMQGQTSISIDDLASFLSAHGVSDVVAADVELVSDGLLSVDTKKLDYKNFELLLGNDSLSGSLRLDLDPLKYTLTIKSLSDIALDNITVIDSPFKKAALNLNLSGNATEATTKNSTLKLDGINHIISGNYKNNGKDKRSKAKLTMSVDEINYDKIISGNKNTKNSGQGVQDIVASLALPLDLDLDLYITKLIWQKNNILAINTSSKFREDNVTISKVHIKNIAGADVKFSTEINGLKSASKITSSIDVNSPDIKKLAKLFGVDSSAWPKDLRKTLVKAKLSGNIDSMNMKTNISAMRAELIADGTITSPFKQPSISDLALQVKHKNMAEAIKTFAGISLNDRQFSKKLDFYSKVSQSGQTYTLSEIKGDLSGVTVKGSVVLALGGKVPDISGDLTFGKINLNSVMGSNSSGRGATSSRGGRWSKSPIDISALNALNANINLRAQKIEYGAWPMIKPSLNLVLSNGALNITNLKAGLFGGDVSFSSNVKDSGNVSSSIDFESKMNVKGADLGALSKALIGKQLVNITGSGNLDLDINSRGGSAFSLINALNGNGTVTGTDIVLDGVDIVRFARALSDDSKTGDSVLGLWKGATRGGQSRFDTLDGAFEIKNGVANISKMDLDGIAASLTTRGNINLPKWTLSTKHTITVKGSEDVPSDVPPFEISFSGSLDNPAETLGQGLINDYLSRKIQRKFNKLLSNKLGLPSNDNKAPQQTTNQQPKQDQAPTKQQTQPAPAKEMDIEDVAEEALKGLLGDLLR